MRVYEQWVRRYGLGHVLRLRKKDGCEYKACIAMDERRTLWSSKIFAQILAAFSCNLNVMKYDFFSSLVMDKMEAEWSEQCTSKRIEIMIIIIIIKCVRSKSREFSEIRFYIFV